MHADLGGEQIRVLEPVLARRRDRAAVFVSRAFVLGPEFERRMEVVEDQCSAGPQQSRRVGGRIVLAFPAAASVEDEEIERRMALDQTPVALEHGHVWKVGKQLLASGG